MGGNGGGYGNITGFYLVITAESVGYREFNGIRALCVKGVGRVPDSRCPSIPKVPCIRQWCCSVDVSVNFTARGAVPDVVFALNFAVGATGAAVAVMT